MTISIDYYHTSLDNGQLVELDIENAALAAEVTEALQALLGGRAQVVCYSELDPNFADEF